jgi:hypothetical protein
MKILLSFFSFLLIFNFSIVAEEAMLFDVQSFIMNRDDFGLPLRGEISANRIRLDFGEELFEISRHGKGPYMAGVEFDDKTQKLQFKNDEISFSTSLDYGNPLNEMLYVELNSSLVELSEERILMKGEDLIFSNEGLRVELYMANILCPTHGVFSSDVREVCLRNSQSEFSQVTLRGHALDADFIKTRADITPDLFKLKADNVYFRDGQERHKVKSFDLTCKNKSTKMLNVDRFRILQGCIEEGNLNITKMNMDKENHFSIMNKNKDLIDFNNLKNIRLRMENRSFTFKAKTKALIRVPMTIRGKIELSQKSNQLRFTISKAFVASIPARSLALKVLKSFLTGPSVSIEGSTIIVQM